MKNRVSEKKAVPVPGRGSGFCRGTSLRWKRIVCIAACMMIGAGTFTTEAALAPEKEATPVLQVNSSYDETAQELLRTPVEGFVVSSPFGPRWGRLHTGIDLALAQGEPIYAADDGTVYFSGYGGGYGNLVKIDHGDGMQTYYAHCSRLLVSEGQQVERGEQIALVGSTGNSTGPHVHFEVIIDGTCVDPAEYLDLEADRNSE